MKEDVDVGICLLPSDRCCRSPCGFRFPSTMVRPAPSARWAPRIGPPPECRRRGPAVPRERPAVGPAFPAGAALGTGDGRADPAAAAGPRVLGVLSRLLSAGCLDAGALAAAAAAEPPCASGLAAAVRAAMAAFGVRGSPLHWELPGGPWLAVSEPCESRPPSPRPWPWPCGTGAGGQVWLPDVASAAVAEGIEWPSRRAACRRARLIPAQVGAVRAVFAGALVTEARAHAGYLTGRPACPSCAAPREDARHRL
jgi:hypothetical protein